jgi:hypothetical protein
VRTQRVPSAATPSSTQPSSTVSANWIGSQPVELIEVTPICVLPSTAGTLSHGPVAAGAQRVIAFVGELASKSCAPAWK